MLWFSIEVVLMSVLGSDAITAVEPISVAPASRKSRFFIVVLAYLADLQDYVLNFSMIASFAFFDFSLIRRFFLLLPSSLIFSVKSLLVMAPVELLRMLYFFCARVSWLLRFSMSMARRSGDRNLNHWSVYWSRPVFVNAYCQWGMPKCTIMSLK